MIELWVKPGGLRKAHDPDKPTIDDIRVTSRLAQLADRVILQTKNSTFIMKGSPPMREYPLRVEFDGKTLEVVPHSQKDLACLAEMREALKTRGGRKG